MDKLFFKNKSDQNLGNKKEEAPHESFLRKFNFLASFKNYVFSKFRSNKYEVSDCDNEISVVSYSQRSFTDVEKAFDLPLDSSVKVDAGIIEALKKLLNDHSEQNSKIRVELLEIIEKTFNRQLDIFEELLQIVNAGNNVIEKMDQRRKQIKHNALTEDSVEGFVNAMMKNLLTQLTNVAERTEERALRYTEATEQAVSNLEKQLGDSQQIKKTNIPCECQQPDASGAAVSNINSSNNN